jgi:hypothetical protein
MLHERLWHEQSFRRRRTKLLCPTGHGLNLALTVSPHGDAVLSCGCHRGKALPLASGKFSVEHLDSRSSDAFQKQADKLFPAHSSPHRDWELNLAA